MPRLMEKRFRNKINLWQGDGPAHALGRVLVNGHNGIGSLFIGIAQVNKAWAVGQQACGKYLFAHSVNGRNHIAVLCGGRGGVYKIGDRKFYGQGRHSLNGKDLVGVCPIEIIGDGFHKGRGLPGTADPLGGKFQTKICGGRVSGLTASSRPKVVVIWTIIFFLVIIIFKEIAETDAVLKRYEAIGFVVDNLDKTNLLKNIIMKAIFKDINTLIKEKKLNQTSQDPVRAEEISQILEPLIRRIIREELTRLIKAEPGTFYLNPDMPLYKDMEAILQQKAKGNIKLHSHDEVWGE